MIRVLEKSISDKIAAGEVIERPLSIVKELIENAIDAGAHNITCEIRNGGKTFLRVTDDGCGIPAEEAETAFLRHATSKIEKVSDLIAIQSLGFRGEALASIAAVTRVSLITKTRESAVGTRLTIHGGEIIEHSAVGCPDGTTMIVTDLFYNTPARREFLKTDAAESGLIIDFMSEIALAFSHIRFQLINNGNVLFTTAGDGDLFRAIETIYQRSEYQQLVEVAYQKDGIEVNGYISRPSLSRSSRRDQVFFINGRVVKSPVIERGLSQGYRERLFSGRYPVAFLFLHVDPSSIDVNIHPNKKEVRFHDEPAVIEAVRRAVEQALAQDAVIVEAGDYFVRPEEPAKKTVFSRSVSDSSSEEQVDIKNILSAKRAEQELKEAQGFTRSESVYEPAETEIPASIVCDSGRRTGSEADFDLRPPAIKPFDFHDLHITGVIFDTYITAVDADHFYLIDQHAAQERIFYEKLVGEYLADDKPSQMILTPLLIDVPRALAAREEEWLPHLTEMGYRIESFGPNTYAAKEIPYFMELTEAENFLHDYIDQAETNPAMQNTVVIDKLITRSCKAAIKAHDKLSDAETEALLRDLAACRNPFSCPHGRPTCIRFSLYDVEKMFKRA